PEPDIGRLPDTPCPLPPVVLRSLRERVRLAVAVVQPGIRRGETRSTQPDGRGKSRPVGRAADEAGGMNYATPTAALLARMEHEPNAVTRAVIRDIIGHRIDYAVEAAAKALDMAERIQRVNVR